MATLPTISQEQLDLWASTTFQVWNDPEYGFRRQILDFDEVSRQIEANGNVSSYGTDIRWPVMYAESTGGSFAGLELLDNTYVEQFTTAKLDTKELYVSIVIKEVDVQKNKGKAQIFDIMEGKKQAAVLTARNLLADKLYTAGSVNTKDLNGLPEMIDDGTNYSTYAGVSRTANTFFDSGYKSTASLSLSNMIDVYAGCRKDNKYPTMIVTTKALYKAYWTLFGNPASADPYTAYRINLDAKAGSSYQSQVNFDGIPVVWSDRVASGELYFLDMETIKLFYLEGNYWTTPDFQRPTNQRSLIDQTIFRGNVACVEPRRNGKMVGQS